MRTDLKNIHKIYGNNAVNKGITLSISEGSIHGILGENGSGKSTLTGILSGSVHKTDGAIIIDGNEADFLIPADAIKAGIGMLYHKPLDFPQLTVLDNFILGQKNGLFISRLKNKKKLAEICKKLGFTLDPKKQVRQLDMSERQRLELVRLIASGAETVILDESATGISDEQQTIFFSALRQLADEGKSIVIVSDRPGNIEKICDRITILKAGEIAGEMERPFNTSEIISMMSDELRAFPARTDAVPFESVLEIIDFHASGGRTGLKGCNMSISAGEIVGLAGIEGNGQEIFLRAVSGIKKISLGEILLDDHILTDRPVSDFREAGICFLPEDRLVESLVPGMTVEDHFILSNDHDSFFINRKAARASALEKAERFQLCCKPESPVESLSKEDRLKLMLALLPEEPKVILLENPSKGLDIESANLMWSVLADYASGHGTVIIFSSPDVNEIINISTRTTVFFDGKIIMDMPSRAVSLNIIENAVDGKI